MSPGRADVLATLMQHLECIGGSRRIYAVTFMLGLFVIVSRTFSTRSATVSRRRDQRTSRCSLVKIKIAPPFPSFFLFFFFSPRVCTRFLALSCSFPPLPADGRSRRRLNYDLEASLTVINEEILYGE